MRTNMKIVWWSRLIESPPPPPCPCSSPWATSCVPSPPPPPPVHRVGGAWSWWTAHFRPPPVDCVVPSHSADCRRMSDRVGVWPEGVVVVVSMDLVDVPLRSSIVVVVVVVDDHLRPLCRWSRSLVHLPQSQHCLLLSMSPLRYYFAPHRPRPFGP